MLSEGARYGVDPVGTVKAAIAPEHQAKVLGGTLQRLLCLGPACGCGT
jgi:hypothetical protein